MRRLTLRTDVSSLDDMLSTAAARTRASVSETVTQPSQEQEPEPEPEPEEPESLTAEEEQELREFALARMAGQPVSAEDYVQPEEVEMPESEPFSDLPQEERPVHIDFSNVREETLRFSSASWFKKVQEQVVILAGVGGIGSNMAMILAKLNPRALYLFDDDLVNTVNIAGQFYSTENVGMYKVDALAENIIKFTNYSSVFACNRRYLEGEGISGDVMICGFDNMRSRKTYFKIWKEHVNALEESERKKCLFMDGRLTASEFQILCFTGEDDYYMEQYEQRFLFENYEANYEICSFKQTGYLADMIGAFMVNLLVNFCANLSNPARNMPLPFFTNYRADVMYLSTEV